MKRLLWRSRIAPLLVALATLLIAAEAAAYRVDLIANWNPTASCAPACPGGVTPTLEVWLDTEGAADILLLGFGVSFTTSTLAYDQSASSTSTYLLYTGGKAPVLIPGSSCGGGPSSPTAGSGCSLLWPIDPAVVQIEFLSSSLPAGVPGSGRELMATLVFDYLPYGEPPALVAPVFDPAKGGVLLLGDGSEPPLGFTVQYAVPEPGTALLVALGLGIMASAGARWRSSPH